MLPIDAQLETTKKQLKRYHQEHLLLFWDEISPDQRTQLLQQINELDLSEIERWVSEIILQPAPAVLPALDKIKPAPAYPPQPRNEQEQRLYEKARTLGRQLLEEGKVAAFSVAGGQGTRLGFDGPKGAFPISPIKNKPLFQIFAEYIAAANRRYKRTLPWYIMTSPLNHTQTVEIFRTNNYFGLNEKDVFIFQQGTLPCFSFDGKILLADKDKIACSPDGHGGSLKALYKSGAIDDMKARGIEYISYFQIDNPLVNIFDPLFIGLHSLDKSEMSSKALIKTEPKEKVGNFCLVDGKVTVIEYSDLPDELAFAKRDDGTLCFQLGSIAIHIINVDFIERLNKDGFTLPLHKAVKKIPHIDEHGQYIKPAEPNGIKLESFVFDALPLAERSIILQTIREEEFAPVKNATGTDSAQTAREMMINRWANWLSSAGIDVPRKSDGSVNCVIEIAPSFCLYKSDILDRKNDVPKIKPGQSLYLQ